jgi:hypothetical protein
MLDAELFELFPVSRALNTGADAPEMGQTVEIPASAIRLSR